MFRYVLVQMFLLIVPLVYRSLIFVGLCEESVDERCLFASSPSA